MLAHTACHTFFTLSMRYSADTNWCLSSWPWLPATSAQTSRSTSFGRPHAMNAPKQSWPCNVEVYISQSCYLKTMRQEAK